MSHSVITSPEEPGDKIWYLFSRGCGWYHCKKKEILIFFSFLARYHINDNKTQELHSVQQLVGQMQPWIRQLCLQYAISLVCCKAGGASQLRLSTCHTIDTSPSAIARLI